MTKYDWIELGAVLARIFPDMSAGNIADLAKIMIKNACISERAALDYANGFRDKTLTADERNKIQQRALRRVADAVVSMANGTVSQLENIERQAMGELVLIYDGGRRWPIITK